MRGFHQARANKSRLRVVFRDDQVSFGFPASATLGDVANWSRAWPGLSRRRHSHRRHNARVRQFIYRVNRSLPTNALTYRSLASPDHAQAEVAVKALAQAGFDMKQLSIVGRGYHTEDNVVSFYNADGRIGCWETTAPWGSLWGLFGADLFLSSLMLGRSWRLARLARSLFPLSRALSPLAPPAPWAQRSTAWAYPEQCSRIRALLKADSFLVFVHGTAGDVICEIDPRHG